MIAIWLPYDYHKLRVSCWASIAVASAMFWRVPSSLNLVAWRLDRCVGVVGFPAKKELRKLLNSQPFNDQGMVSGVSHAPYAPSTCWVQSRVHSMPGASWSGCCFNHIGGKTRRNESMSMAWWKGGMTGNAWKPWFLTINIWMSYRLPLIRWWNEPSELAGRNRFCIVMHSCCRPMLQRAQQKASKLWKVSTVSTCHLSEEGADKSWINHG